MAPNKIRVIPHGPLTVHPDPDGPGSADTRIHYSLEAGTPLVVLFGFLRPYKGIEDLIAAWDLVRRVHPEARLLLAGKGDRQYIRLLKNQIASLKLTSSVITDFRLLPEAELAALIDAADVLVYPYRAVTQSGALLAGMSSGSAIVASRVGGLAEVIEHGETGLLVEPQDQEALAREICALLASPARRRALGARARRSVEDRFSWSKIARDTLDLYADVLERTNRPEP